MPPRFKKKWFLFMAAGLLISSAAADPPGARPIRILTSFYPIYIATINVAAKVPGVEAVNLTKPFTGCLHDYPLTPEEMKTISSADIFVVNGAGMESFLDRALRQAPGIKIIEAGEGIELIGENPHVWVSLSLAMKQVENIARGLAEYDTEHAELYQKNAAEYRGKLEGLRSRMQEDLKDLTSRDIVTFHEAFPYFAKEFGLNIVAVIEREPGSEPQARELAETVTIVRNSGVKALFAEPQYPAKAAETIARETGAAVYTLDPAVTGDMGPDAYLRIMERNLQELQRALK